jgi:hypothetical protein
MVVVLMDHIIELRHLLEKRGVRKGSDDRDLDYILEQEELW